MPIARAAPLLLRRLAGALACAVACGTGWADTGTPPSAAAPGQVTHTRAQVRSLPDAADPLHVRLKVLPRGKLPFTTIAFRVEQPALLQGLRVGDEVGFTAERRADGNTLTRIRKVAPCVRFQPCPLIVGD